MQIGPHGRVRRVVAMVTAVTLSVSPVSPLLAGPAQAPASNPAVGPPAPKVTPAPKARRRQGAPAAPAAAPPVDGGWPRAYATPERRQDHRLPAAGGELGPAEAHGGLRGRVATSPRARPSRPWVASKVEADTKVSVSERLVSFKEMRITESNFPTLPKEQTRELVAEIDKTIPDDERVIALDRVLASHGPQPDHPEGGTGREGGPAHHLLQPDARRAREHRRRSDLEPDQGERPQVRRQHELGPLPARRRRARSTCARKGSS